MKFEEELDEQEKKIMETFSFKKNSSESRHDSDSNSEERLPRNQENENWGANSFSESNNTNRIHLSVNSL
jgi:hypothetical protein